MRWHLVRHGYRRLLAHHGSLPMCSALPTCRLYRYRVTGSSSPIRYVQRRTIFGVFKKPPRDLREPEVEPGYEVMLRFRSTEIETERPPPRDELIEGFGAFFRFKNKHRKSVNSTQAFAALHVFRHLQDPSGKFEHLSRENLLDAREALMRVPQGSSKDHLDFCKEIYRELRRRGARAARVDMTSYDADSAPQTFNHLYTTTDLQEFLSALCQYGASEEAAEVLSTYWTKDHAMARDGELWILILAGLASEGKEKKLLALSEKAQAAGLDYVPRFHEIMTTFYIRRKQLDKAMEWFKKPIHRRLMATPQTYYEILGYSDSGDAQSRWATQTFQELCDSNPSKEHWDAIFQWAVVSLGKTVGEVESMVNTMIQHNTHRPEVRPDSATIHALVRGAMQRKDALLAERFVQLGIDMGVNPDFYTYALQLDYRIDANDLTGAMESFQNLLGMSAPDDSHVPVVNKFIRSSCAAAKSDTERLLGVLSDAEQKRVTLEASTVVALCMVFLRNDQQYDVIDTLSLHTLQLSFEDRKIVADAFVSYCRNGGNSTARTWDAYSLLRQFFPDTSPDDRIRIMKAFFARKRADMACSVFGHMRAMPNPLLRPTGDMYIQCFEGLGRVPDMTSLKIVHNMLKMDTTIQMSTKMYNALMVAYSGCEDEDDRATALELWNDVTNSTEGPSYNSLAIIFRACQGMAFGEVKAREIWAKMQKMDIDVPVFVYNEFCAAIAGQGQVDEAKKLVSEMKENTGYSPDMMTIGLAINALPGQNLRVDFESWAEAEYPKLLEELRRKGRRGPPQRPGPYKISQELKA